MSLACARRSDRRNRQSTPRALRLCWLSMFVCGLTLLPPLELRFLPAHVVVKLSPASVATKTRIAPLFAAARFAATEKRGFTLLANSERRPPRYHLRGNAAYSGPSLVANSSNLRLSSAVFLVFFPPARSISLKSLA